MTDAATMTKPEARKALDGNGAAPVVRVRNAVHAFKGRGVFSGLDLDLFKGEIYGLLGPNGVGKTTLMKAISGRVRLNGGEILIEGADILREPSRLSAIGFAPQEISLYHHLTVKENLQVFAGAAGVPQAADLIRILMDETGLAARADQICATLSGGYQRRVNICVALLKRPRVLLLDEPTVGIDIDAREAIHRLLDDLRRKGAAILVSTHDLDQAQRLCSRVGLVQNGRIGLEGRPEALVREAFGDRLEVVAELRAPADAPQRAALEADGFAPHVSETQWVRYDAADAVDVADLQRRLSHSGLRVREIRVREPDLSSLFLRGTQQETAP
ncbi:ABC-2 type transport system ATP-binding protein [Rhodoblastus acidophilus]|uniref:ABC-2 type transport system ATP-binding protein n=1 Tax=Rhodoblastus acidophilus TaxID=1074 RepID=A0A212R9B4_RHOAC|nr:ABC transporter ATP-binding protein [Rhodoblastus acidophilus]SNB68723.1 ABC-2 type transport system ATP-binding protein [Rhodoblastus acidophilus]